MLFFKKKNRIPAVIVHAELMYPSQVVPQPRGSLANLTPQPVDVEAARMALQPGQALLSITAVGINFRDVLNTLGMYPGDPGPPGE